MPSRTSSRASWKWPESTSGTSPADLRRHPVVVDEDDVGRLRQGAHVGEDLVGRAGHQLHDVLVSDGGAPFLVEVRVSEPVDREALDLFRLAVEYDGPVDPVEGFLERSRVVVPTDPDVREPERAGSRKG